MIYSPEEINKLVSFQNMFNYVLTFIKFLLSLLIGIILIKLKFQSKEVRNVLPWIDSTNNKLELEIKQQLKKQIFAFDLEKQLAHYPPIKLKVLRNIKKDGFLLSHSDRQTYFNHPKHGMIEENTLYRIIKIAQTNKVYMLFLNNVIGFGAFGTVHLGQDLETGQFVAIKKQSFTCKAEKQDILTENKHLLSEKMLLGMIIHNNWVYTIMPYWLGTPLLALDFKEKCEFAVQFAKALKVFHSKNKVHNDLHRKNVLYNSQTKECHLIDFGAITNPYDLNQMLFYRIYRAEHLPEQPFMINTSMGDVYQYGCILAEIFNVHRQPQVKAFIDRLTSSLLFQRPSLDEAITFFTSCKEKKTLKKQADNSTESARIKNIIMELNNQNQTSTMKDLDFRQIALCSYERHIYTKALAKKKMLLKHDCELAGILPSKQTQSIQNKLRKMIRIKDELLPSYRLADNKYVQKALKDPKPSSSLSISHVSLAEMLKLIHKANIEIEESKSKDADSESNHNLKTEKKRCA